MMEPSFEKLLALLAEAGVRFIHYASKNSLIAWKDRSAREKDRIDVIALRKLLANPKAFD